MGSIDAADLSVGHHVGIGRARAREVGADGRRVEQHRRAVNAGELLDRRIHRGVDAELIGVGIRASRRSRAREHLRFHDARIRSVHEIVALGQNRRAGGVQAV